MIISREEGIKLLRNNLEAELERLSKMEANEEAKKGTEEIKRLLGLSDDELAKEFESKRKNNENKELNEEELDNVAGGVIVDRGMFDYWIIDEKTGKIIDNEHCNPDSAEEIAKHAGVSTEKISMDECKKRYGLIADPKDPNYTYPGDINYWWDNFKIIK